MFERMEAPSTPGRAKVLVLSGSIGHGHMQTAQAIKETAERWYGTEADVHVVDYMEQVSPHLHSVGTYCFVQWVKLFPSMYGYLFNMTRKDRKLAQLLKGVRFTSLRPLIKLVEQMKPTVIVSTFPAASAAVSKLKERGMIDCPAVTVITDHTDHSFWLHPYTDLYLAGSEDAKTQLIEQGVPQSRIQVTGIPVRPAFYESYSKTELRKKYELDSSKLTVLLMGGGCGLMDPSMLDVIEQAGWAQDMQFIIICGSNDKLRSQLERWAESSPLHVRIEGYVKPVHEYMAMSDLMITKSGGVTTSEAVVQQLPLLVYKPLPGQEQDNIRYLLRSGVACCAEDAEELVAQLSIFSRHPETLQWMRERAQEEAPRSPFHAMDAIVNAQRHSLSRRHTMEQWLNETIV
ncbi:MULTISPECIES: MGDG synthase family glycosyltransferase [Paenibacillus]|uniref:Galactosyldiacylglycerol synthase n=1 Tax=Paenibacillus alvei TaxID=44250 RepID=A0ABT4E544_PAEAL|nr:MULTISPECIES: glycosyltransferase [Paenibacillus]EPY09712.1 monogalactosyldiacylglycerol synthase [Paenibacillus alvei A6-6i-x]MCY9528852.1 galactosyldiacylglycerol synthase [Paenibacillus alvei]SDG33920.1 processive 1,2-diacylglycerol beta-glucosyltransferase [Paenibacillus sp. cl6col]